MRVLRVSWASLSEKGANFLSQVAETKVKKFHIASSDHWTHRTQRFIN